MGKTLKFGPRTDKLRIAACAGCKHWRLGTQTCAAFPDKIPRDIFLYGNPHTTAFPGDHGIRFEPKPPAA